MSDDADEPTALAVATDAKPPPSLDELRRDLSPRQLRFATEYVSNGGNALRAAEAAGYAHPINHGSRTLSHPKVRAFIDAAMEDAGPSAAEVIASVAELARFDPAAIGDRVYKREGDRRVVDWAKVEELGLGRFIQSVGMHGRTGHESIKWYSRFDALSSLAKFLGLTSDTAIQVNIQQIATMTDAELDRIIRGG